MELILCLRKILSRVRFVRRGEYGVDEMHEVSRTPIILDGAGQSGQ